MKNKESKIWIEVAGRLLLGYVLILSQCAWAGQNPKTMDKANSPQQTSARAGEKQSSAATTADPESAVAEERPSSDASHQGIKVHGHWTIEVRNPDGSLVTHREFDNSIISAGAGLIANLLQGVVVPAGWSIILGGTNASQTPANQPNPCGPAAFINNGGYIFVNTVNGGPNYCYLYESSATVAASAASCSASPSVAFCTVTRTPPIGYWVVANPGQVAISLSGSFTAPNGGYIGSVATNDQVCSTAIGNNSTTGLATMSPSACSAGTNVGIGINTNYLTVATLQSPIQVQGGQSVSVTVNISFS